MIRIDQRPAQILRDRGFDEKTDPGISSSDNYQLSQQQQQPGAKTAEKKSWTPKFLEKRRALKEAQGIVEKMMRLDGATDEAIWYFFKNDLPKLAAASRLHPEKVHEYLQAALAGVENTARAQKLTPWFALAELACGDSQAFVQALENVPQNPAYLFALESVSAFRPREATHLLKQFFEKAGLKNRMATLRTAAVSENLGNGHLIGEFFVKLMAATTAEERQKIVEPFLESLIQKSAASSGAGNKVAWLQAYYHGWKNEELG